MIIKTKVILVSVLALLGSGTIYAFSLEGLEDIEVVETPQTTTTTTKKENNDFLDKDLAITMGGSSLIGNSKNGRSYGYLRARYEKKWNIFKLNYEGMFENIKISATQKDRETKKERTSVYQKDQYRTEELYLNIDLLDNLSLAVGRQKIIWGQLEPYSPTNFVFPMNLSSTSMKFSKAIGALAQNVAKLSFYPTERVLIEANYFVEPTYDAILKNKLDNPGTFEQLTTYDSIAEEFNFIEKKVTVDLPKGTDKKMLGFRIISYQDWGTIGMSYFDGYDANGVFDKETLKKVTDSGKTAYYSDQVITLNKQKMIGVELSVPLDNWTLKVEYAQYEKKETVRSLNTVREFTQAQLDYAKYILNENEGKLYYSNKTSLLGVGLSTELERWDLNFVLFNINTIKDAKSEKISELEEKAFPIESSNDVNIFPGILVSYYLNKDKISSISLAAGIVGVGAGGILSYSTELMESLDFSIGYQSITYFSSDATDEDNDGKYEKTETAVNGIIVGIEYSF